MDSEMSLQTIVYIGVGIFIVVILLLLIFKKRNQPTTETQQAPDVETPVSTPVETTAETTNAPEQEVSEPEGFGL